MLRALICTELNETVRVEVVVRHRLEPPGLPTLGSEVNGKDLSRAAEARSP